MYRSERFVEISGEDFLANNMNTIHPEDRPGIQRAWDDSLRDRTACKVEYRYLHPNTDHVTWVLAQWAPVMDELGTLRGFVGAVTDVTERVETQRKQIQEVRLVKKGEINIGGLFSERISH